jgi:hypothetical protein
VTICWGGPGGQGQNHPDLAGGRKVAQQNQAASQAGLQVASPMALPWPGSGCWCSR